MRAVFRIAGAAAINLLFILTAAVLVPVVLGFLENRFASFLLATERSVVDDDDDDNCCCWDVAADSVGSRTCWLLLLLFSWRCWCCCWLAFVRVSVARYPKTGGYLSALGSVLFCEILFDPVAVLGLSRVIVRFRFPLPLAQPIRGLPLLQSAVLFSRTVSFWLTSNAELYRSQSERLGRHLFPTRKWERK